jgi:hypothetical protein
VKFWDGGLGSQQVQAAGLLMYGICGLAMHAHMLRADIAHENF